MSQVDVFKDGPVILKTGLLTRIKENCPDYSYEDIIEERWGEPIHKVFYVHGRRAIVREDEKDKGYTLFDVFSDEAEPYTHAKTLDELLAELK